MRTKTTTTGKKDNLDRATITQWELAMIEEALRSHTPPGLSDLARGQYKSIADKISRTMDAKITMWRQQ